MVKARKRKAKGGSKSALVDPKVMDRLQAAAEAAGLESVEELANLVADSGAIALPPSDGVSEVYSMEDLGMQMHSQMPPPLERPAWFENLAEPQKIALVVMLKTRGYSSHVVARDFGITELEVVKVFARYADDLGAQVLNVRLNTLVGNLQLASERAGEGAMQKDDWGTYWRIQKEMIALLQSLGIVKQAIRKVEVAHKFDDQKSAELEAILELERKQANRRQELKMADVTVTDAVPVMVLPKVKGAGSMDQKFEDDQ